MVRVESALASDCGHWPRRLAGLFRATTGFMQRNKDMACCTVTRSPRWRARAASAVPLGRVLLRSCRPFPRHRLRAQLRMCSAASLQPGNCAVLGRDLKSSESGGVGRRQVRFTFDCGQAQRTERRSLGSPSKSRGQRRYHHSARAWRRSLANESMPRAFRERRTTPTISASRSP